MKKQQANKSQKWEQTWQDQKWHAQHARPIPVQTVGASLEQWNSAQDNNQHIQANRNEAKSERPLEQIQYQQVHQPVQQVGGWQQSVGPTSQHPQPVQNKQSNPIIINPAALAQAEQLDAEYIRLLKDILLGGQLKSSEAKTVFVPVEQHSGQGVDANSQKMGLRVVSYLPTYLKLFWYNDLKI